MKTRPPLPRTMRSPFTTHLPALKLHHLSAFLLGLLSASLCHAGEAVKPDALDLLPGFKLELVRTADPAEEGSWISIAKDPQGRLVLGAEKKEPLSRLTLKDGVVVKAEILVMGNLAVQVDIVLRFAPDQLVPKVFQGGQAILVLEVKVGSLAQSAST